MRFIADESVEIQIVHRLRVDGHDCLSVQEQSPGAPDEWVLGAANSENRILVTADKDFGELVYRLCQANAGVLLVRLAGMSNLLKADTVSDAILQHADELPGCFAVVEPGRIRIRKQA